MPVIPSSVSTSTIVLINLPQCAPFAWRIGASSGTATVVALMSVIFISDVVLRLKPHRFQKPVRFNYRLCFAWIKKISAVEECDPPALAVRLAFAEVTAKNRRAGATKASRIPVVGYLKKIYSKKKL
jgi:hypothetical protein